MCSICGMSVEPLPRFVILPRDPKPLVAWLANRQAEDAADEDTEAS